MDSQAFVKISKKGPDCTWNNLKIVKNFKITTIEY